MQYIRQWVVLIGHQVGLYVPVVEEELQDIIAGDDMVIYM